MRGPDPSDPAEPRHEARPVGHAAEAALVRLTRMAVAGSLMAAAGVSSFLAPRERREEPSVEEEQQEDQREEASTSASSDDVAMLLAATAITAAARIDGAISAAVRTARDIVVTLVRLADLSPMHPLTARTRDLLDGWTARGRRDSEDAVVRLADAYGSLLDAVVADVIDRVDIGSIVERLDVDAIVARIDLDRLIERIDLNRVIERVDLDRTIRQVDVDAVIDGIDLDRAISHVDIDGVIDRVDLDRALHRIDLPALTKEILDEIEVQSIIRESTETLTDETVGTLRTRAADADRRLAHVVDDVLRRRRERDVSLRPNGGGTR